MPSDHPMSDVRWLSIRFEPDDVLYLCSVSDLRDNNNFINKFSSCKYFERSGIYSCSTTNLPVSVTDSHKI